MKKNILITGCAGFIGFHLSKKLLKKKLNLVGVDSINNYYSKKLKLKRLRILKKNKKFKFHKVDLTNRIKTFKILEKYKFDLIIHLAAQPGVRYSLDNPDSYIKNNIVAFSTIIDFVKEKNLKFIYASSSSVYGNSKKFPKKENDLINPNNIYSLTKKNNEEVAGLYSKFYGVNSIGLRFFTVYGEYGRPDMFILKFLESVIKKKKVYVYNKGNHFRDFTYIDDTIDTTYNLIKNINQFNKGNYIFNICRGKSESLKKIINILIKLTKYKEIIYTKSLVTEVYKTHGSNVKVLKYLKKNTKKFINMEEGIKRTYLWFKKNQNLFL